MRISDWSSDVCSSDLMDLKPVEAFMARAARLGLVLRVVDNRYYPPDALARLGTIAETLAAEDADGLFDAAAFRDRSGIGRNLAIKVLEFFDKAGFTRRSEEHTSELQSLMRISYAVFCLKKKNIIRHHTNQLAM